MRELRQRFGQEVRLRNYPDAYPTDVTMEARQAVESLMNREQAFVLDQDDGDQRAFVNWQVNAYST